MKYLEIADKRWNFLEDEAQQLAYELEEFECNTDTTIQDIIKQPSVSTIFREYDLRGDIHTFNDDVVRGICCAMSIMIKKLGSKNNQKIIIGSDNEDYNVNSKELAKKVFSQAGLTVYDAGIISSPGIYFAQQHYCCSSIAAFTASHNPYGDKGMKAGIINYSTFGPAGIELLKEQFLQGEYIVAKEEGKIIEIDHKDLFEAYYDMLKKKNIVIPKNIPIVINTLNAPGGPIVNYILKKFGANTIPVNYEMKESKPGDPQKNPELEQVKIETQDILNREVKKLEEQGIDVTQMIAFAFDRDADRMVPVGQQKVCSADELAILAFRQKVKNLRKQGKTKEMIAICDLKSSMALFGDKLLEKNGLKLLPWYTGHSYIKQYMRYLISKGEHVIGGAEKSGHQFQEGCYDEPLEDALLLIQYLTENKMNLEQALDTITPYEIGPSTKAYLDADKFKADDTIQTLKDRKYDIMKQIIADSTSFEGKTIIEKYNILEVIDLGLNLRVFFGDIKGEMIGNFVFRPSSNEEVFTINIEVVKEYNSNRNYKQEIIDIQNFIAFDLLASRFEEMTTISPPEKGMKKGWMNKVQISDNDAEKYLDSHKEWKKIDEKKYQHTSGKIVIL